MTEPDRAESKVARSWAQLDELLFQDAWDPGLQRIRVARAFRGMSTRETNLRSRLLRLGGDAGAVHGRVGRIAHLEPLSGRGRAGNERGHSHANGDDLAH